jgi:hypothetical protein
MTSIGELSTGWGPDYGTGWSDRTVEDLVGVSDGGHLMVPMFRPFDFLTAPNVPVTFLSAKSNRAAVEAVRGTQPVFHRNADFDEAFFQWGGTTTYESEWGVVTADTGDLLLIPEGVSHRATGGPGSLRVSWRFRDPITLLADEERHTGHTEYAVTWNGGPDWPVPPGEPARGAVMESVHTWEDQPGDQTLIRRAYDRLVGATTKGRRLQKIRLFDIFSEISGRRGPGPMVLRNEHFHLEIFNSIGPQFAFHRGQRADEAQLQFIGPAENVSEFGGGIMDSGDIYVVKRGIAHRVIGSRNYRRVTWYSGDPWTIGVNAGSPPRTTSFAVTERVIDAAPWRKELEQVAT